MSIQAIAQVLDLELNDPSSKLVLIGIANHTSPTGQCFPSVARLCRYSGLGESTVRDVIKRLETAGYIRVERQPGRSSIYYLTLPLQQPDPTPPDSGPPPLQQPDPNRKRNRNTSASDARADLPDDWKPDAKLRAKLDKDYPSIDIDEQAKAFVLANRAKGTAIINPNAAFEVWMMRTSSLKMPVPSRPTSSAAGRDPRDPAALAAGAEQDADHREKLGDWRGASEAWLTAAKRWIALHGKDQEAQRCAAKARSVAKPGSWYEEETNRLIAAQWGDTFEGTIQ